MVPAFSFGLTSGTAKSRSSIAGKGLKGVLKKPLLCRYKGRTRVSALPENVILVGRTLLSGLFQHSP
jgi:hypothetical protein